MEKQNKDIIIENVVKIIWQIISLTPLRIVFEPYILLFKAGTIGIEGVKMDVCGRKNEVTVNLQPTFMGRLKLVLVGLSFWLEAIFVVKTFLITSFENNNELLGSGALAFTFIAPVYGMVLIFVGLFPRTKFNKKLL